MAADQGQLFVFGAAFGDAVGQAQSLQVAVGGDERREHANAVESLGPVTHMREDHRLGLRRIDRALDGACAALERVERWDWAPSTFKSRLTPISSSQKS